MYHYFAHLQIIKKIEQLVIAKCVSLNNIKLYVGLGLSHTKTVGVIISSFSGGRRPPDLTCLSMHYFRHERAPE
jgi:hypothetical protein